MTPTARTMGSSTLAAYYRNLITFGTLIFLGLVGWTMVSGWQRQQAEELSLAQQRVHESSIHLKSIIKAATDHVTQMQHWATQFPDHAPYSGPHTLDAAMNQALRGSTNGEFTLDALAALPEEQRLGQMLGLTNTKATQSNSKPTQRALGLSLLGRMGDARKTSPFLRWSFFFSADQDLLAVTPWATSRDMLGDAPDIHRFLPLSWTYDITRSGLPENNPERKSYWTPAYPDQAGAGLMVSHGVPVYWGNQFVGVVGTDVLLDFLGDFLRTFPDPNGTLLIVNEHGQILGDRAGAASGKSDIPSITSRLPNGGPAWQTLLHSRGESLGEDRLFVASIDNPQWHVVYLLPQSVISARVMKAHGSALALAALLVIAAFIMQWALWRMYVAPALGIADFVAKESAGGIAKPPEAPKQWRPWIAGMAQAFTDRRDYLAKLEANNEALERSVAQRTQELLAANQRLEKLSITDPLTGAYNRRHLFDVLEKERQRIQRSEEGMAVLLIDLDHFKRVNDQFGHPAGDAVLREFVRRCQNMIRATDTVCRYGGEEFVIVLPCLMATGAITFAERLRSTVADLPVSAEGNAIPVTVSIGIAVYQHPESLEELLARADQQLYRAKEGGRNRVCATQ